MVRKPLFLCPPPSLERKASGGETSGFHGTVHWMRDLHLIAQWQGSEYLTGDWDQTINWNVRFACDPAYPVCDAGGDLTITFTGTLDEFAGGWEGRGTAQVKAWNQQSLGYEYTGVAVARGWGELDGWRLQLRFETQDGTTVLHRNRLSACPLARLRVG